MGTQPPPVAPAADPSKTPAVAPNTAQQPKATTPAAPATTPAAPATATTPAAAPATDAKAPDKGDAKVDPKVAEEEKAWKEWTPPSGLSSFPDHGKRMDKDREARFLDLLSQLGQPDNQAAVDTAKSQILSMGKDVLPYVVAGCYHANAGTRAQCMKMLGQIDGNKTATKQAIEVFYAAMPTDGKAAWYQVQFIDAVKDTLPIITGQSFITVQARDSMVQNGLKQYVDWYNANFQALPPQVGEKKVDQTDKDYVKKITESRKLKLEKREWPAPPSPSDLQATNKTNDRPVLNESSTQREADKGYSKEFNRVGRDDALKRPQDKNSGE